MNIWFEKERFLVGFIIAVFLFASVLTSIITWISSKLGDLIHKWRKHK